MSEQAQSVKSYNNKKGFWKKLKLDFKNHWQIYLMAVPVILYFAIFNYAPMVGIIMAFQKYQIRKGIFGSQFVGMTNFMRFFSGPYFWRTLRNTLLISLYGLLLSFPLPIVFALCLNEVRNTRFKKIVQTISYLPYFISVVVVVSILFDFGKSNGILTQLAMKFGWSGGAIIASDKWFRTLYIGSNLWQHLGYNSIIFISALAAIDPTLYEAARIDGANRWQQTLHVTIPGIASTIVVLL
ncbi:MAG: sugar ABC transporter permease, partial [Solobacterium sp.]|nr:sugar ABC transporter permease [Solobacterium sp.]